jgi:hypothetical protein
MKMLLSVLAVIAVAIYAFLEYNKASDLQAQLDDSQKQIAVLNAQIIALKAVPKKVDDWRFKAVQQNPLDKSQLQTTQ